MKRIVKSAAGFIPNSAQSLLEIYDYAVWYDDQCFGDIIGYFIVCTESEMKSTYPLYRNVYCFFLKDKNGIIHTFKTCDNSLILKIVDEVKDNSQSPRKKCVYTYQVIYTEGARCFTFNRLTYEYLDKYLSDNRDLFTERPCPVEPFNAYLTDYAIIKCINVFEENPRFIYICYIVPMNLSLKAAINHESDLIIIDNRDEFLRLKNSTDIYDKFYRNASASIELGDKS